DFFDAPPKANEAKALGQETALAFQHLSHELKPLLAQASQYPFLKALEPVLELLKVLTGKPYAWYLTDLKRQEDDLLDAKEKLLDPIRRFMIGQQKEIFTQAFQFVQSQTSNFAYVEQADALELQSLLQSQDIFK